MCGSASYNDETAAHGAQNWIRSYGELIFERAKAEEIYESRLFVEFCSSASFNVFVSSYLCDHVEEHGVWLVRALLLSHRSISST